MTARDWPDSLIKALCDLLRERRLASGLTIYRVSQASGVTQQAISNYEKHNRRPTLECLFKVSLALGLKPSKLLALAEKRVELPGTRSAATDDVSRRSKRRVAVPAPAAVPARHVRRRTKG